MEQRKRQFPSCSCGVAETTRFSKSLVYEQSASRLISIISSIKYLPPKCWYAMDGLVSEGVEGLESAFGSCAVRVTFLADAILLRAANLDCFFIISLPVTQGAKF